MRASQRLLIAALCLWANAAAVLASWAGQDCNAQDLKLLRQQITHPVYFCQYYAGESRSVSFLPGFSVSNLLEACACVKSSSTASALKSTARATSTRSSAKATKTAVLKPYVPDGINGKDLTLLKPANTTAAYYGASHSDNSSSATVAQVNLGLQYESINLDHSSYVAKVVCNTGSTIMTINFNAKSAFATSEAAWQAAKKLIFVTSSTTCGSGGHTALFLAEGFSFTTSSMTSQATGRIVQLSDVYHNLGVDFGTVSVPGNTTSSPTTTTTTTCTALPTGTVGAACFDDFDTLMDNKLGYYVATEAEAPVSL
ncbi:hypothetical protein ANO11243_009990 [Dothideomycetidae sp. 11243]|nr:hypothetical protein ANO11243_009990 [fungal sp. No.11243]